ncbi:MAG TPA: XdhC/CoxI family protein [Candidatus Sulfomarinibacteraceae bacterium]|nr:XdhC/CoxI family protein [Candidatus Sulfomarinibacteraceae bacterium]
MREIIADVDRWLDQQHPVALATVVETWGSAPRGVGAKMALTPDGQLSGSVSGGCVEGAVFEAGVETLATGQAQLLSFGVADETAWDVGLACGGQIEVFVEAMDDVFSSARRWLNEERAGAVATVIKGPPALLGKKLLVDDAGVTESTLPAELAAEVAEATQEALNKGARLRYAPDRNPGVELFIDVIQPPETLVMVGGVHIAVALTAIAKTVGYRTIVVDPRRAFGSDERFPHVDRLIKAWPDEAFQDIILNSATAVAMLTHDPKIDDPALKAVLPSPAFYVGALGSTRTHEKRRRRLLDDGLSPDLVNRIQSPIGLDIGARTPEEIAVAVMAEVIAARRQRRA